MENKLHGKECNGAVKYDGLINIFQSTLDKHAPLKQKQVRRNQDKAIKIRSRIKNRYNKWLSRENFLALKQIKNKHANLTKTAKKEYFAKSAENQPSINKNFWNSISLFLTNKNVRNDVIALNEEGSIINDELEVAETLNSHYIDIVKMTCRQPPEALGTPKDQTNEITSVDAIINNYKNHPSINQIRKECSNSKIHSFPEA